MGPLVWLPEATYASFLALEHCRWLVVPVSHLFQLSWLPSSKLLKGWWLSHKVSTYCESLYIPGVLVRKAEFLSCHYFPVKSQEDQLMSSAAWFFALNPEGVKSLGRQSLSKGVSEGASHRGLEVHQPGVNERDRWGVGVVKNGAFEAKRWIFQSANQTISFLALIYLFIFPSLLIPSSWQR